MGEGEALRGPPTLGQEGGLPLGMLSAMSAGRSLGCLVLMEGVTKSNFAILHSGTAIYDGGKSERSDADITYRLGPSCPRSKFKKKK